MLLTFLGFRASGIPQELFNAEPEGRPCHSHCGLPSKLLTQTVLHGQHRKHPKYVDPDNANGAQLPDVAIRLVLSLLRSKMREK